MIPLRFWVMMSAMLAVLAAIAGIQGRIEDAVWLGCTAAGFGAAWPIKRKATTLAEFQIVSIVGAVLGFIGGLIVRLTLEVL